MIATTIKFPRAVPLALALMLGACTTYGTGTSPAVQTVEDLAGIAALSNNKEPIDYEARPKIVAPPSTASLPPPQADSAQQTASVNAADWPDDPDKKRAALKADVAAREAAGEELPKVRLATTKPTEPVPHDIDWSQEAMPKPGESEKARKLFADAKASVAVDENGQPIRRYLSDPPSVYRVPDPDAPTEIIDKPEAKKKFKWPWQWFASN